MPRKFDPIEFNYELVNAQDSVFHYQKVLVQPDCIITDIIELAFWSKQNTWIIFIEASNMKQFAQDMQFDEWDKITLFIGKLNTDFDFEFQMKRICIDPQILIN